MYNFAALAKLAAALRPGEPVDLGITYAGACAQPYLSSLGAPKVTVWVGGEGHYDACSQPSLFVPWNPAFIARYLAAVQAQWNAAATIHDASGATLQSHIIATRQAVITNYNTDELAVPATGCKGEETAQAASKAWRSAGYSVTAIQAA